METGENIHISINILQRKIDLWVRKEHEAIYREAEKQINERAANFTKRWNYTDAQDLLSKLLLELTVNYIAKDKRLSAYQEAIIPRMENLSILADKLDQTVDALGSITEQTQEENAE